jgi:hypothetical protein
MLLFRGPDWDAGLSREETQQRMDRVMAWFDGLQARGIVRAGNPLARKGVVLSGKNSREVADGPFTESKEVIGGYLVLQVAVLDEAVAIARQCPTLDFGITVEVRPMLDECPISARLLEKQTCATA